MSSPKKVAAGPVRTAVHRRVAAELLAPWSTRNVTAVSSPCPRNWEKRPHDFRSTRHSEIRASGGGRRSPLDVAPRRLPHHGMGRRARAARVRTRFASIAETGGESPEQDRRSCTNDRRHGERRSSVPPIDLPGGPVLVVHLEDLPCEISVPEVLRSAPDLPQQGLELRPPGVSKHVLQDLDRPQWPLLGQITES